MTSRRQKELVPFSVGNEVRIRVGYRSPYAGHYGVISSVDFKDLRAPYLVRFHDGIQFRYQAEEVESPQASGAGNASKKMMKSGLYRIFAGFLALVSFPVNTQPSTYPSDPPRIGTRQ
jgi:hypothetical protein